MKKVLLSNTKKDPLKKKRSENILYYRKTDRADGNIVYLEIDQKLF